MRLPKLASTLAVVCGLGAIHIAGGVAVAAPDAESRIASYESEAQALQSNLPQSPNAMSTQSGQKRLVDAQVAYSTGDYDTASIALFDLIGKTNGQEKETATFYLGESLYQKGDYGAARTYFQSIKDTAVGSKYYQQSLVRLVEIAITERDAAAGEDALRSLEQTGAGSPAVAYARGKWAFSQARNADGTYDSTKLDNAIAAFNVVPKGSDYELQATYYLGTTYVAKQDLAKATDTFTNLVTRKPRTNVDRRVIELSQLALGRVYYERDQPAKAIDNYLLVDRRSDLFPTALYEVAWVYVKSKQFDKALTALELLTKLDPQSTKTPTVKILEGNLRIRKAQMIRQAQIAGTVNNEEKADPATEYKKAETIFDETHELYYPSFVSLDRMVKGALDPASFIDQISGRSTHTFAASAPIPEAAAQWLREEPEVERVVHVEMDLADVEANLTESEAIINRLEGVLASGDKYTLYPALSSRRMRIAAIQHDLIGIRIALHDKAGAVSPDRKSLQAQYAALGNPEQAYGNRTAATRAEYEKIDEAAREVESTINSSQAIAVALRKYSLDVDLPADQKVPMQSEIDSATKEARAIEDELAEIHRELVLGKDLAGVGDQDLAAARELRHQLKGALDNEARSASNPLIGRATVLAQTLESVDAMIDSLETRGLEEIKAVLEAEKKNLAEFKAELAQDDGEARTIGSQVLAGSFKAVHAKFDDIVTRTDVGGVDVLWSQKEDSDDDYKRLNLARSRDLKQLRDEFRFVLDDASPQPKKEPEPAPAPTEGAPSNSPDKSGTPLDTRVKPGGEKEKTAPTVKPDTKATTPATGTGTQPKTGTTGTQPKTGTTGTTQPKTGTTGGSK
ncbi:MAG TPA: tetratricopeptide repeat protein [Kofleriaceae bacterium]|nr:tetratricopeptide repeat protein [Kofleriaceae bacterium]